MNTCQKCIIPDSYPGAAFDGGICSLCRIHDCSPSVTEPMLGRGNLLDVLTSKPTDKYHCVVPLSGGKDSTYVLMFLVRELGLRPLAVCVDNGFLVDSAKRNVAVACEKLSVALVRRELRFYRNIARKAFSIWKCTGRYFTPCSPCETSLRSVAINEALRRRIPYIVWGATDFEDGASTFLSPDSLTFRQRYGSRIDTGSARWRQVIWDILGDMGFWIIRPTLRASIPFRNKVAAMYHTLIYLYYSIRNNLDVGVPEKWRKYLPLIQTSFENKDVDTIYFFDYIPYDPHKHIEAIRREAGWAAPPGREARMDCKLHSIAAYQHLKETGITSDGFTFSVLIRCGKMHREEALEKERINKREVLLDFKTVLSELRIDTEGLIS